MPKFMFSHHCYPALRSRSKLRVKVKGRDQGHGSRSNVWRAAVDIRGSALPSAEKAIITITSQRLLSVCL